MPAQKVPTMWRRAIILWVKHTCAGRMRTEVVAALRVHSAVCLIKPETKDLCRDRAERFEHHKDITPGTGRGFSVVTYQSANFVC
jgi:hypothetical protein